MTGFGVISIKVNVMGDLQRIVVNIFVNFVIAATIMTKKRAAVVSWRLSLLALVILNASILWLLRGRGRPDMVNTVIVRDFVEREKGGNYFTREISRSVIWATACPIRRHLRPIGHPLVQIAIQKANSIELENVVGISRFQ
jgi:hypothetical protein